MNRANPAGRGDSAVPALVLGGSVTALGAVRSLGPLGLPVFLTCEPKDVAAASRWASTLGGGLPEFSPADQLVRFLEASSWERMVLVPCSDTWAETVASLPPGVAARFPSYLSPLP